MLATIGDVKHVVTLAERSLVGVALADGKLLWKHPYATRYNAATPVVDGDTIYVSIGEAGTSAVKVLATDPAFKVLSGPWTRLTQSLTVPAESFVFAYDPAKYDEEVKGAYTRGPLLDRFKLPAGNTHTVVQKLSWLEQVRVDQGNQREPIGAWVAAVR